MKKITVTEKPLVVGSGRVQLTGAQAAPRMSCLTAVGRPDKDGGGVFEVTSFLQFKVGETLGFEGEMTKSGVLVDLNAAASDIAKEQARVRAEQQHEVDAAAFAARASLAIEVRQAITKVEGIPDGSRKLVLAAVDAVLVADGGKRI